MSRIAVLPPVAVALGGGAAVLFVLLTTGAQGGPALWAVLAGALALAVMAVAAAAVAARRAAHSVAVRVEGLRRQVAEQAEERRAAAGEPVISEAPDGVGNQACAPVPRGPAAEAFGRLADDLERVHRESLEVLSRRAASTGQEAPAGEGDRGAGVEHRIEVFVNVARRLQSLAHREIAVLDELEREIEDPDLLRGLFHVDHLATRVRRHAENLAVLGGAVSRRQWSEPVALEEVLRSAVAEVEQYARVRVVPPVEGTLRGHAVADVIHLLAELVENATVFSPPHTQVAIRADAVAAGLAVEVEDRGLGMPSEEQERMNALLADPASVDVAGLLADGRIGLYVVSQLARRHGVRVRLGGNIYGGVQAVLVLPQALLGPRSAELPPAAEDAPADPPTAGGPADSGEWRLPGGAACHGRRPDAADTEVPGVTRGPDATAWHGARPEAARPGPVRAVSGLGEHGPSSGVEPGPEPSPERAVSAEATPRGLSRSDVVGRPGDEGAWPGPLGATAPQHPEENSPTRSDRPAPGALPDAWRQATPAAWETTPPVPSPRHGEDAVPQAEPRAPLPVRERDGRATPAGALPGTRPAAPAGDPVAPEALAAQEPSAAVPPPLPRRRAQSHLAPQLRSRPTPRAGADATEEEAGHDPHLMAAFRRGVGLAEAHDTGLPGVHAEAGAVRGSGTAGSGAADGRDAPTGL